MPLTYQIETDQTLEKIVGNLHKAPKWYPAIVRRHMPTLGRKVKREMKAQVSRHRYKGDLEDKMQNQSSGKGFVQTIGSEARRGAHDAGILLELGTRPHTPPWAPIAEWAEFRGLPAFPIWYSITTKGTKPHPFVHATLNKSKKHILETARRIAEKVASDILAGTGTASK